MQEKHVELVGGSRDYDCDVSAVTMSDSSHGDLLENGHEPRHAEKMQKMYWRMVIERIIWR